MGATFDDNLIFDVASVVGKEARAFANFERAGRVESTERSNAREI